MVRMRVCVSRQLVLEIFRALPLKTMRESETLLKLCHELLRYRALSKPRDALLSDEYLTLHELLAPLYYRTDFEARIHEHTARAIELLDAVNPDHVTPAERDALEFELPKLRLHPNILAREAFERFMGLAPPAQRLCLTPHAVRSCHVTQLLSLHKDTSASKYTINTPQGSSFDNVLMQSGLTCSTKSCNSTAVPDRPGPVTSPTAPCHPTALSAQRLSTTSHVVRGTNLLAANSSLTLSLPLSLHRLPCKQHANSMHTGQTIHSEPMCGTTSSTTMERSPNSSSSRLPVGFR